MCATFRYFTSLFLVLAVLFAGCENDIERINMVTEETEVPVLKSKNIQVIYSDSARVKVQILAPFYQSFPDVERPYDEFPEGMEVFFYNDSSKIESEIRADYTIYYAQEKLWHATGNVIARRLDNGDALYTEELFWDMDKEQIYSNSYSRVHNEDNILYGKRGFKSHQNLSNWQLIGSSGTINVQNEE
ncbi:MAG: LPS export ABC transporter periplasmic protein LptC [Bacteroidota bacterium]